MKILVSKGKRSQGCAWEDLEVMMLPLEDEPVAVVDLCSLSYESETSVGDTDSWSMLVCPLRFAVVVLTLLCLTDVVICDMPASLN